VKQQIFRRVTAQRQLLENHELRSMLIARLADGLRDSLRVARDVPDNEV
jgi:hypothetical protein